MAIISKEQRTPSLKKEEIVKKWYLVDASDKTLGRLTSQIASRLRGKHKPRFTPHVDCGDNIVVINAGKIKTTGNKFNQKVYYHHSRYPGGLREMKFKELIVDNPVHIITEAVKGMLPKSRLGDVMLTNLRVFAGGEHNLHAQKPEKIEL